MVSICEIGSVARGQNDQLSDKDLLAIGFSPDLDIAISDYKSGGWNIARYSPHEFNAMVRARSLFVQHVKQDGRLIRDDEDFLRRSLDLYMPSRDYINQLASAIEPLRSIEEIDHSYWGQLYQADVLYVSVRNACILHKATVAEPEFDFESLVFWVCKTVGLNLSEQDALLRLRSLKHAYRSRLRNMDTSGANTTLRATRKLLDYWTCLCISEKTRYVPSNGYFEVRALEGELVRAVGPIYMDQLGRCHELSELWSTICSTDPYKPRPPHLQRWSKCVSDFLSQRQRH